MDEFYRVAFRRKIYGSLAELQADLDAFLEEYNEVGTVTHETGPTTHCQI